MKQEKKPSAGRHTGTEAEMKIYTPHTAEQKTGAPSAVISDQAPVRIYQRPFKPNQPTSPLG